MPQPGAGRKLSLQQRYSPSECLLRQHIHARLRPAALSPDPSRRRPKALFREKTFPVFTLPTEVSLHVDVTLIIAIAATID
ncbi:hypothetical protein E4U50_006301, partial [Claviceps purpurea]